MCHGSGNPKSDLFATGRKQKNYGLDDFKVIALNTDRERALDRVD